VLFNKYYNNQVKKNRRTGHVAGMSAHRVLVGNLKERDHQEDLYVETWIIVQWILEKWDRMVDLIHLAQARDQRSALVNTAMNF
jgi:hypothetical protein